MCSFDRAVDQGQDLGIDCVELVVAQQSVSRNARPENLQAVAVGAVLFDLALRSIILWVALEVPEEPSRRALQCAGAISRTCAVHCPLSVAQITARHSRMQVSAK